MKLLPLPREGRDLPPRSRGPRAYFHGFDAHGAGALVVRCDGHDFAQYDDRQHPHAFGWWRYPLNHFERDRIRSCQVRDA